MNCPAEMQAKLEEFKKEHNILEPSPTDLDGVAGGWAIHFENGANYGLRDEKLELARFLRMNWAASFEDNVDLIMDFFSPRVTEEDRKAIAALISNIYN